MSVENKLSSLKANYPTNQGEGIGHVLLPPNERQNLETWEVLGRPYTWHETGEVVKRNTREFTIWVDSSHGMLALFQGDKVLSVFKRECIGLVTGLVVLDRTYYGVDKYMWI